MDSAGGKFIFFKILKITQLWKNLLKFLIGLEASIKIILKVGILPLNIKGWPRCIAIQKPYHRVLKMSLAGRKKYIYFNILNNT